jgi:putative membrane protein
VVQTVLVDFNRRTSHVIDPLHRPASSSATSRRFPLLLLVVFAAVWVWLAIAPLYRQDWLLENVLVVVAVPLLVWSSSRLRLRNGSYVALFVFLLLHAVGAHYTYSEVPVDAWSRALFGVSPTEAFGFERNHYDRLVHFLYGLLVTPAALDIIDARASPTRLWRWMLAVGFVASHSVLYELVEWAAAVVFGGDLGVAYLGTQGDVWDAQKDMALALVGSVLAATLLSRPPARQ